MSLEPRSIRWLRVGLSSILLGAGAIHLVRPDNFLPAMPDYIPWHEFWVAFTGLAEIAGAFGLWVPRLARLAAAALVIYFVAVLPAHFHVAMHDIPMFGLRNPWLWVRIPLQLVFVVSAAALVTPPRDPIRTPDLDPGRGASAGTPNRSRT